MNIHQEYDKELKGFDLFIPDFLFGDPSKCTYCGSLACEIDHVIPISQYAISRKQKEKHGIRTFACTKCNKRLSDKFFKTFNDRILYIAEKSIKDAKKFSNDASWSDEEIASLDHTLRTFVANRQLMMREVDAKTTWIHSSGFWRAISSLQYWERMDQSSPKYIQWVADYFNGYRI